MIQRKQTLWLALIALICFSSVWINIPFWQVIGQLDGKVIEDADASIGFSETSITIARERVKNEPNTWLMYSTLLTGTLALVSIFLFKNRNWQILIGKTLYGTCVLMVFFMYYYGWLKRYVDIQSGQQIIISIIFPLLIAYANYRAMQGIRHDENLVKSYDRIR